MYFLLLDLAIRLKLVHNFNDKKPAYFHFLVDVYSKDEKSSYLDTAKYYVLHTTPICDL